MFFFCLYGIQTFFAQKTSFAHGSDLFFCTTGLLGNLKVFNSAIAGSLVDPIYTVGIKGREPPKTGSVVIRKSFNKDMF